MTKTNNGAEWQDVKGGGSSEVCIIDFADITGRNAPEETIKKIQYAVNNNIPVIARDTRTDTTLMYYLNIESNSTYINIGFNMGDIVAYIVIRVSDGMIIFRYGKSYDSGPFITMDESGYFSDSSPRVLKKINSDYNLPYIGTNTSLNEAHYILLNTSDHDVVVSIPTEYISNTDSITIEPNSFGEVNIVRTDENKWYLRAI